MTTKNNNESNNKEMQFAEIEIDMPQEKVHPLSKSIIGLLESRQLYNDRKNEIIPESKSYNYDPSNVAAYTGLYRKRFGLLPYNVSKQMAENNELLSIILNTRGNQLSSFGQVQTSRYDIGYKIIYRKPSLISKLSPEKRFEIDFKLNKVRDLFYTCGNFEDLPYCDRTTLPEYLQSLAKYALLYGHVATEIVYDASGKFHSFKLVDSGTIYKTPFSGINQVDRQNLTATQAYKQMEEAYKRLQNLSGQEQIRFDRLDFDQLKNGEYAWIQVINEIPRMAFRDKELLVHNYYPSPSIEYAGYPRPPIDDVARSLTTNLNAMMHNHLFFFQGRGTKGGLFIKSDQINENILNRLRLHMQSSINSVRNAWRMPVVGLSLQDQVDYVSFEQGTRDQEFMYLSENTMKMILSAYSVAPEEVGMAYLSKGINGTQSSSESNNEYKIMVARKAGLEPLLRNTQVLMNRILSIIDPELYEYCTFKFVGLDSEDSQKEVTRLQNEMNVFSTMNDTLRAVEKEEIPVAGNIPLNPQFLNVAKENVPMNVLLYSFTGNKSSLLDPSLNFYQSGFWFQYQSIFQGLLKSKGRIKQTLETYTEELKELFLNKLNEEQTQSEQQFEIEDDSLLEN